MTRRFAPEQISTFSSCKERPRNAIVVGHSVMLLATRGTALAVTDRGFNVPRDSATHSWRGDDGRNDHSVFADARGARLLLRRIGGCKEWIQEPRDAADAASDPADRVSFVSRGDLGSGGGGNRPVRDWCGVHPHRACRGRGDLDLGGLGGHRIRESRDDAAGVRRLCRHSEHRLHPDRNRRSRQPSIGPSIS